MNIFGKSVSTIDTKLKALAAKVELDFETVEKYIHTQLDTLIGAAQEDAGSIKAHIEEVASKDVAKADTAAQGVETEVKTDAAQAQAAIGTAVEDVKTDATAAVGDAATAAAAEIAKV